MADSDQEQLEEIASEISAAIDVYRAKIATPESFEELRFFVQQELKAIEGGFANVEEVLKLISRGTGDGEGEKGDPGAPGAPGAPGRGIKTFKQESTPSDAFPGDVWFVQGYQ